MFITATLFNALIVNSAVVIHPIFFIIKLKIARQSQTSRTTCINFRTYLLLFKHIVRFTYYSSASKQCVKQYLINRWLYSAIDFAIKKCKQRYCHYIKKLEIVLMWKSPKNTYFLILCLNCVQVKSFHSSKLYLKILLCLSLYHFIINRFNHL